MSSFPETIRELWALLKSYAFQELVEPLRGLPVYVGLGLAGAVVTLSGGALVVLGLLRMLQTEAFESGVRGGSSALPYLLVVVSNLIVIVVLARRINRQFQSPA